MKFLEEDTTRITSAKKGNPDGSDTPSQDLDR